MTEKKIADMAEAELKHLMNNAAQSVEYTFAALGAERPLFVLVVLNDRKKPQHVSNCDEESAARAMRGVSIRMDLGEDVSR